MGKSLAHKILDAHRIAPDGSALRAGHYRVDSVLFHDMSGILPFIGCDAMGMRRANVPVPVVFTDHNLVSVDPATANDQAFVRSGARAFGLRYSLPGNGVCHSVYVHRIARPGMLLIGADSHTATCGAVGMIGIGMGGMDVGVAMSGLPFRLKTPKIMEVRLTGALRPGVSAKDAALALLRKLTISGAVGKILEYTGEGVGTLSVTQRATIANMGAEMGATSSIFPADERVRAFMTAQGRAADFTPMAADEDAEYDERVTLDLCAVEPMVALPGRPDRGCAVREAGAIPFSQIFIGSCTNGSYTDIARAAMVLRGRKVSPETTLLVSCGSRQIYAMLLRDGYIGMLVDAGARILECACGPCMGIGHAPASGAKVLRTSNRNFKGRSGTPDAEIYLCGTETAAASAITGRLTDVRDVIDPAELDAVREPAAYPVDDAMMIDYDRQWDGESRLRYTKNIRPIPVRPAMEGTIRAGVSLKAGDGISTDDIVPALPHLMTLRANIPELSKSIFHNLDLEFASRAVAMGDSVIVAGENYAQGSSREHAAIGCMHLGVRAVLVRSIHRIHRANLINYGVLPLLFERTEDYAAVSQGDMLELPDALRDLRREGRVRVRNLTTGGEFFARSDLSQDELDILAAGGLLPLMGERLGREEKR